MGDDAEILVRLPHRDGVAGVYHSEQHGMHFVTSSLGRGGTGLDGFEPGLEGLTGGAASTAAGFRPVRRVRVSLMPSVPLMKPRSARGRG